MTAPTATSAESMVKKVKPGDAQRKAEEVKQLVSSGGFPSGVAVVNPRLKVVEQIPGPPVEGQMMDEILKLLSDDRIRKIGIWGMGGVGKTTLVRTLNNKLEDSSSPQLFDIVIWITVSKGTGREEDVKKIQDRLVERLKISDGEHRGGTCNSVVREAEEGEEDSTDS
ncbi:putative disease resistance protein [Acorus gramineus]|uniref:Disease resistance protein n=1 Tax=Acorus gramineus TaxID=55184 RepID=A0AAV9A8G8_ACOGR|nr:putative disease resistance protein [Acorus gramineus]